MSNTLIPLEQVEFEEVQYIKIHDNGPEVDHPWKYKIMLPSFLAKWDVFSYWEKERTASMEANLKPGDVLFDIGTESGWLSAVYATFVGGENMVLFEPTPEFWPNIKATWEHNHLQPPKATWAGLVGADIKNFEQIPDTTWPEESDTGLLIDAIKYRYIHEDAHTSPQITIDEYVKRTGIIPNALTMDTEGAEILILTGAKETLKAHKPLVWTSLHPDLALRDYHSDVSEVYALMKSLGYEHKYLATDHEIHELFYPNGTEVREP